jgi:hypothetical protein
MTSVVDWDDFCPDPEPTFKLNPDPDINTLFDHFSLEILFMYYNMVLEAFFL